METRRAAAGIFLLSASLLTFELTLIRVYSVTLFYHFAFMAISVAMLGLSAAALTVNRLPAKFKADALASWGSLFGACYAISLIVILEITFRIPVNAYKAPDVIADKLALIYILSAIPFYFAGLVFSGLFASFTSVIGKLYAWDLIGAGLGAVLIIPLLNWAGGEAGPFIIAASGLAAAAIFAAGSRRKFYLGVAGLALLFAFTNHSFDWLKVKYSKGALLENLDIKYNKWNSISRIMAIPFRPGTDAAYTWCPSPNFPLPIMPHLSLMIDDGAATPVLPFDGKDLKPIDYLKNDLTSLSHRLRGNGSTLVIGCGGGRDVLTGLMSGAEHIDAVDINPLIFDAMNGELSAFNGSLYKHPRVTGVISEGRAFARRNPGKYDLLQVAMIDTWAATTAGAYSLSENSLYTVEAFEDYLRALKPGGIISFTRFYFEPPQQALKIVSLYLEAARLRGISEPEKCILVAYYESLATVIFKAEPFTEQEITRFKADVAELGFYIVYTPTDRVNSYFRSLIESRNRDGFYKQFPYDVRPNTDERPFFFNMLKMKDFLQVFEIREGQRFNYYATYTLLVLLGLSLVAVVVVLILPQMFWGEKLLRFPGRGALLLYFVGLGLAYIMIETALLQRFVLLLENPTVSASAVVAGMLISSGLGSWFFGSLPESVKAIWLKRAFILITAMMMVHIIFGYQVIHALLGLPLVLKILVTAVLLLPLGFAMGMPLPAGMTAAGVKSEGTAAWCWAINGAASVVASPLAVTLAMASGFNAVLVVSMLIYIGAFGLYFVWTKHSVVTPTNVGVIS